MRLALIVDAYAPSRTSAAVQMRDLASELAAQGHSPTVIVPSHDLTEPSSVEWMDGVQVVRVKAFRTKDIGYIRRFLAEIALPFMVLRGIRSSPLSPQKWDGIVWYSPTIFLGPTVGVLKRRSKCRSYLILRDLFPDWAVDAGVLRRGFAYWLLKAIERYQYSVADVIGVQSPGNLKHFERWERLPPRRVEVLNNWLSGTTGTSSYPTLNIGKLEGKLVFVYLGNMGPAQSMDCLLELASRLVESPARFLFVGRGSDVSRLKKKAKEMDLANVSFWDEIEPADVPLLLSKCHVGLLALDPRHKTHNIPGKFLAYLRAGLPVLARINEGNDLEALIKGNGLGRVCVGDSTDCLYQAALELIQDPVSRKRMGVRGQALAHRMYSATSAAMQIVAALGESTSD